MQNIWSPAFEWGHRLTYIHVTSQHPRRCGLRVEKFDQTAHFPHLVVPWFIRWISEVQIPRNLLKICKFHAQSVHTGELNITSAVGIKYSFLLLLLKTPIRIQTAMYLTKRPLHSGFKLRWVLSGFCLEKTLRNLVAYRFVLEVTHKIIQEKK